MVPTTTLLLVWLSALAGRMDLPPLRHVSQRVQDRAIPADAWGRPGQEGQPGHEGDRLGGAHELRGDVCYFFEVRVAPGVTRVLRHMMIRHVNLLSTSSAIEGKEGEKMEKIWGWSARI